MMDPIAYKISGQDEAYFDCLKKVFIIMSDEMEERRVRKKLHEIMPEKEFYFTKYMNDTELLFGNLRKISKEFQKSLQRERLKTYIRQLQKEQPKGYMDSIAKYEEMLMKLDGLHLQESADTFDWSQLQLPKTTFSTATAFFKGNTEDIEIIEDEQEVDTGSTD